MMRSEALISVQEMTLAYGGSVVVDKLSLTIRSGELVSIVGPSGCGKTSLLLCLAGLVHQISGTRIISPRLSDAEIVYVPQQDALLQWRTLRANIRLGRELHDGRQPFTAADTDKWAKTFNASEFLYKRTQELSGGMRKRICLARSFYALPSVVLLDEPFNNLDFLDHHSIEGFLRKWIAESSRAVACVTHDIGQAVAIGDRVGYFTSRSYEGPPNFNVIDIPESLRQRTPAERRLDPEFNGFVSRLEHFF